MTPEQVEQMLAIAQAMLTEMCRIADALELGTNKQEAPNYQQPLANFQKFDWASIGAIVERKDQYGAAIVSWRGKQFTRRSPSNKFGEAIWFSRCIGKTDAGENKYERLITFKRYPAADIEPVPPKVLKFFDT